jgi:hypothetical protein
MNKFLLISGIACLMAVGASAGTITYNTTGSIACNGVVGCSTITNGVSITQNSATVTLVYDPNVGTTITSPSNINYGAIDSSATSATAVDLTGLLVTLNVNQTVPSVNNGTFGSGSVSGTLTGTSSGASITWLSPTSIFIGPETYTVFTPTVIVAPTSNAGVTTIQGAVADTAAPEPTTIVLTGAGLCLLGSLRRRLVK